MDYSAEMSKLLKEKGQPPRICSNAIYTGDFLADFKNFVFGQGGGKSKNPNDLAVKNNPQGWPPLPDKDGKKYHTVNDITWQTFMENGHSAGMQTTTEAFYGMTREQAGDIAQVIFDKNVSKFKKYTQSQGILALLFYTIWGGSLTPTFKDFIKSTGNILWDYEKANGSELAFDALAYARYITLDRINKNKYNGENEGWYSGISNFWRVFRPYANEPA